MTSLEHKQVKKSRQKDSPVACPLAGTGWEATHNSRWNMRYRASITHSISRGLMAIALHFILFIYHAGFCRTGERIVAQAGVLINAAFSRVGAEGVYKNWPQS